MRRYRWGNHNKIVLKKRRGIDSTQPEQGPMPVSFENGNKLSGSANTGEFLDELKTVNLSKMTLNHVIS